MPDPNPSPASPQSSPDHCRHCGLLLSSFSPCCEEGVQEMAAGAAAAESARLERHIKAALAIADERQAASLASVLSDLLDDLSGRDAEFVAEIARALAGRSREEAR